MNDLLIFYFYYTGLSLLVFLTIMTFTGTPMHVVSMLLSSLVVGLFCTLLHMLFNK